MTGQLQARQVHLHSRVCTAEEPWLGGWAGSGGWALVQLWWLFSSFSRARE